jgi:hypothetical protein
MAASSSMISIFDIFIFLIIYEHQIIFIMKFNFLTGFSSPDYNGNPYQCASRAGKYFVSKKWKQLLKKYLEQHFINYYYSTIDTISSMLVFTITKIRSRHIFPAKPNYGCKRSKKVTLLIWLFATKVRQREFS